MSAASNYLENEFLDHALGTASWSAPSNVYFALFTTNPTDAGTGNEVSGSGYARQAVTFDPASGGTAPSDVQITFTASGGSWGTVNHWAVFDAVSSGNMLFYGPLTTPRTIGDGESIVFNQGTITISAD